MTSRIGDETRARIATAWSEILASLASGEQVGKTLKGHNLSRQMLAAYLGENSDARTEWEQAREQSADAFKDEALQIARDPMVEVSVGPNQSPIIVRLDATHARTRIDTLKWAARIANPRLYGDKQQLDVNVRTVDLTRIISDANARLAAQRALELTVIEGEAIRVAAPAHLEDLL